ncbi:hypothetical protein CI109_104438 [Kwoniella shandongensis]|uniref:AAA+ ATPase domain-containing protein n=1 Tax=Kwoniella shandongensis TaxID=1734106 RepID=A0AAJ8LMK4_9TREE
MSGSTVAPKFTEVEEIWLRGSGWRPAPEISKLTSGNEGDAFVAHHRLHPSGNDLETATWIEIRSSGLLDAIKMVFPQYSSLYDRAPGIDGRDLFLAMDRFDKVKGLIMDHVTKSGLTLLLDFVARSYVTVKKKYEELPTGTITWPLLWWIMSTDSEVESPYDLYDASVAYKLDSWQYTMDDRGRAFVIKAHYYQWSGSNFQKMVVTKKIPEFKDIRPISELEFWPLTAERKSLLQGDVNRRQDSPIDDETIAPELRFLLPPSVQGFSLKTKRWGDFLIDNLEPVHWVEKAFDHLVIPDTYRKAIRSLVDVHTGTLGSQLTADVVEGKGEGLILALHGRPGTGKTLTAEAVSEHLHRPLYVVSAGELGTTVTALEKKLGELATTWKAVLLIDEADIFLEKRSATNIERNALVGVFLRLLEYYSGVLFVTTNRLSEFDEAFASRFSLTLSFKDLDRESRQNILRCRPDLDATGMSRSFDLAHLSEKEANGRVIKQATRTAQAMALADGESLSMKYLLDVLDLIG